MTLKLVLSCNSSLHASKTSVEVNDPKRNVCVISSYTFAKLVFVMFGDSAVLFVGEIDCTKSMTLVILSLEIPCMLRAYLAPD